MIFFRRNNKILEQLKIVNFLLHHKQKQQSCAALRNWGNCELPVCCGCERGQWDHRWLITPIRWDDAFPAEIRKDECHCTIYSAGLSNYFQEKEIQANKCKEGLRGQMTRERTS